MIINNIFFFLKLWVIAEVVLVMNKKNKLQKKILKVQQVTSKMIHKSKNRNKKKRKKVMNKSKQIKKNLIKMNMTINLLQKKSNLHKKKKKYRKNKILIKF